MNITTFNTSNYLVPSSGTTHAVQFNGIFTGPFSIDWRQFSIDNFPFQPQGVFVDNTASSSQITINIQPINYNLIIPAGVSGQYQFPAPDNQTCNITAVGSVTFVFVDFPVLPTFGTASVAGTISANIISPNPLPVVLPVGSQLVQGTILTNASSNAYSSNLVVKTTAGILFKLSCYSSNAAQQWIQIHDAVALPANGSVPKFTMPIALNSDLFVDWNIFGRNFVNGIIVSNSTTGPTLTIGAADCFFDVQYL